MTRCYCFLAAVLLDAFARAEDPQQCDAGAGGACGEAQAEALEALEAQASRVDLLQRQRLAVKHGATELVSDQQGDFSPDPEYPFAEYYHYSSFYYYYYYYYYDYLSQTIGENYTVGGHASMPFSGASGQRLAARRGAAVFPTDWYYDDTLANQNETIGENYTVGGHASMPFSGASGHLLESQQLAVNDGAAELVPDEQAISSAQHEHGEYYYYWYGCHYYCLYYYFDDLIHTIGENYTVGGHASMPFSGASGQRLAAQRGSTSLPTDDSSEYYDDDTLSNQNQTIGENYSVGGHASMPFSGASR